LRRVTSVATASGQQQAQALHQPAVYSEMFGPESTMSVVARANAGAADLAPIVAELQAAGATSPRVIAVGLDERGVSTSRGTSQWQANTVAQLLARLPG
jgi:hypothetical protein